MAKLENVLQVDENKIQVNGSIYEKSVYPIIQGDIVQAFEEDDDDIIVGGFYEVLRVDRVNDFEFNDDAEDKRYRDHNDKDFVPYRKVADSTPEKVTIVIDQPVHLVIKNIASIELPGGAVIGS